MTYYDFRDGLQRINNILYQEMYEEESRRIPSESQMTYSNGYTTRVSSIFVDIRNSTKLFANKDREMVTRVIRSFVSEVIEVLQSDDFDEIGIRGDCVYGIYSTPKAKEIFEVFNKATYINSLMGLLNRQYRKKNYPFLKVGIGLAVSDDFVVKVGRKGSGINDRVWIGSAVTDASKLSSYGNKNGYGPIVMSDDFHHSITKYRNNGCEREWFEQAAIKGKTIYHCDVTDDCFDNWIEKNVRP